MVSVAEDRRKLPLYSAVHLEDEDYKIRSLENGKFQNFKILESVHELLFVFL